MTPEQRKAFDAAPRPPRFTGMWRGRHYHKGRRWLGPTNEVGRRGPQLGRPYMLVPRTTLLGLAQWFEYFAWRCYVTRVAPMIPLAPVARPRLGARP